jgi:signal transduction histidine kinase
MVALHHRALIDLLNSRDPPRTLGPDAVKKAGNFFAECMSPFEMTHRAFGDANEALRRMNDALEEEVKGIAHALHDDAGQLLAAVHLSLDQVTIEVPPSAQERLREVKSLLGDLDNQMRRLSHELRPTILDDLGLVPAIEFLSEGVAKRSGLRISFRSRRGNRLPAPVETVLYRVVQQALHNVTKHAHATFVKIQLRDSGKTVRCSIVDDGVGFDPGNRKAQAQERGFGLLGMREKLQSLGGVVRIQSAPGQGTKLSIEIPREV